MARVAVDEVMLREPGLLEPGRKPIGPVKIDWSHPSTRGVKYFIFWPNGDTALPIPLFDSVGLTPFPSGDPTLRVKRDGMAVTGAGNVEAGSIDASLSFASAGMYPDFSFMIKTGVNTAIDYGLMGAAVSGLSIWWDTNGGQMRLGIFGGSQLWGSQVSIPADGLDYTITGRYSVNNTADIYIDGKPDLSGNPGSNDFSAQTIRASGINAADGLTRFGRNWIYHLCAWDRLLSEAELHSLGVDPYQFLIPA